MRRLLLLLCFFPVFALGQAVHLRPYGVPTTVDFVLYDVSTGALDVDEVDGGAEITADCNETPTNPITNDFVDEGSFYSIALTAGEMSCARVVLTVAATDTNVVVIETYGHPSSQHPVMGVGTLRCEINTAFFAGSTTTLACILTDLGGTSVTQATGDLEGKMITIMTGADVREGRFISDTTWDGANSELRLTLSRALPSTQADAVLAIIQ